MAPTISTMRTPPSNDPLSRVREALAARAATRGLHGADAIKALRNRNSVPADRITLYASWGYSDARIADRLNDELADRLASQEDDPRDASQARLELDAHGWWTVRQIRYRRQQLAVTRTNRLKIIDGISGVAECREISHRVYAARHGWGHLIDGFNDKKKLHVAGFFLRPQQVDILDALADHGALTSYQIAEHLLALRRDRWMARHPMARHRPSWWTAPKKPQGKGAWTLAEMVRLLLLIRRWMGPRPALYALAPGVERHTRTLQDDGIEKAAKRRQKQHDEEKKSRDRGTFASDFDVSDYG